MTGKSPPSSNAFARPLCLELRPSRVLTAAMATAQLLAVAAVLTLAAPLYLRCLACLLIMLLGLRGLCRHGTLGCGDAVARLIWRDERWEVVDRAGRVRSARLDAHAVVTPALVVLVLAVDTGRRTGVVISADRVDPVALRRLRARLLLIQAQGRRGQGT